MGSGLDAIKFFKTTMNETVDNINTSLTQKKTVKRGYLSNGQPNCVFDANIAATAGSHKTAAGDY